MRKVSRPSRTAAPKNSTHTAHWREEAAGFFVHGDH
jgi:hypothetical protein